MIDYGYGIVLGNIHISTISDSFKLRNSKEYNQYFRQTGLLNLKTHEDWLLENNPNKKMFSMATEKVQVRGLCGLTSIDYVHSKAEISCYTEDWKHDKAAIQTLIEFGFNDLNLNRLWAETFETHKIHLDILDELGFEREGVLRQSYFKDGKYLNSIIHSILRDDYI